MKQYRLGTRGSELARTQSGHVAAMLTQVTGVEVELVIIKTRGDQVTDRPLQNVGGKGLFTKEIEDALLAGEIDFAVHSLKDLPTEEPAGLSIAAIPHRVDPRDVVVGARIAELPHGAVVGTGSVRRSMQLKVIRPDLDIRGIRGNVDTRIDTQRRGEYAAILLAAAGLTRLGRGDEATESLSIEQMVPAVGQGALGVQCRTDADDVRRLLEAIHHVETGICTDAERAFLAEVSGGCSAPAACHARIEDGELVIDAVYARSESDRLRRDRIVAAPLDAVVAGRTIAQRLLTG